MFPRRRPVIQRDMGHQHQCPHQNSSNQAQEQELNNNNTASAHCERRCCNTPHQSVRSRGFFGIVRSLPSESGSRSNHHGRALNRLRTSSAGQTSPYQAQNAAPPVIPGPSSQRYDPSLPGPYISDIRSTRNGAPHGSSTGFMDRPPLPAYCEHIGTADVQASTPASFWRTADYTREGRGRGIDPPYSLPVEVGETPHARSAARARDPSSRRPSPNMRDVIASFNGWNFNHNVENSRGRNRVSATDSEDGRLCSNRLDGGWAMERPLSSVRDINDSSMEENLVRRNPRDKERNIRLRGQIAEANRETSRRDVEGTTRLRSHHRHTDVERPPSSIRHFDDSCSDGNDLRNDERYIRLQERVAAHNEDISNRSQRNSRESRRHQDPNEEQVPSRGKGRMTYENESMEPMMTAAAYSYPSTPTDNPAAKGSSYQPACVNDARHRSPARRSHIQSSRAHLATPTSVHSEQVSRPVDSIALPSHAPGNVNATPTTQNITYNINIQPPAHTQSQITCLRHQTEVEFRSQRPPCTCPNRSWNSSRDLVDQHVIGNFDPLREARRVMDHMNGIVRPLSGNLGGPGNDREEVDDGWSVRARWDGHDGRGERI